MHGYIVEVSPEIEETLSQVMPGAKWTTWKPYFVPESTGLIEEWSGKVQAYLNGLPEKVTKVSSRAIKRTLEADKVAPMSWTRIIRTVTEQHQGSKELTEHGVVCPWKLEGQSLVKQTLEHFGFIKEVA